MAGLACPRRGDRRQREPDEADRHPAPRASAPSASRSPATIEFPTSPQVADHGHGLQRPPHAPCELKGFAGLHPVSAPPELPDADFRRGHRGGAHRHSTSAQRARARHSSRTGRGGVSRARRRSPCRADFDIQIAPGVSGDIGRSPATPSGRQCSRSPGRRAMPSCSQRGPRRRPRRGRRRDALIAKRARTATTPSCPRSTSTGVGELTQAAVELRIEAHVGWRIRSHLGVARRGARAGASYAPANAAPSGIG